MSGRAGPRLRLDPRAGREVHRVAGGSRPRFTIEAARPAPAPAGAAEASTGRRPRRDPRAEAAALAVAGRARPRIDRSLAASGRAGVDAVARAAAEVAATAAAGSARPTPVPPVRIVDDPAYLVLVVPDLAGRRLSAHDRQILGAGRLLADAGGGAVAVLAAIDADWGAMGADRVVRDTTPSSQQSREGERGASVVQTSERTYDPEARTAAIAAAVRTLAPRHVVFAETADGGDIARRVAALLGEPMFAGAESVSARGVTRPAKSGRVEQRAAPPRLMSVLADVVAAHGGPPHEARTMEAGLAATAQEAAADGLAAAGPAIGSAIPATGAILDAELVPADPDTVPLAEANFVVSAGNGVSDFGAFRDLAAALGATPGASRVVCDAGLMPRDRQVGASGTVLDATCYFALGIAGAPQHLQGVAKCEHVVAVNTDLHAAMIERAGLAIVADAQAVMPALLAALAAEAAGDPAEAPPAARAPSRETPTDAVSPPSVPGPAATGVRPAEGGAGASATSPASGSLRAAVLLSAGRHPVSGRAAAVRTEIQATALALGLGATVRGVHAGRDPAAVADHLGHGLATIDLIPSVSDEADPVPALSAALAAEPVDLVLAGRRGQGGDDSGLVPYRLAAALGFALVADVASVAPGPRAGTVLVEQALGRGARRRLLVRLPAVVTVHPAAPPPRPYAFGPARRGRITAICEERTIAGQVAIGDARHGTTPEAPPSPMLSVEERPWRRRPRLIAGAVTGGSAEERLKAATEVAGGGGRLMVDPAPEEAAREILAFLRGIGVLGR